MEQTNSTTTTTTTSPRMIFNVHDIHRKEKGFTTDNYKILIKQLSQFTNMPLSMLQNLMEKFPNEIEKLKDPKKLSSALSNRSRKK